MLHRAGLFLGYELLGASFSNPHGHFEDAEIVDLHERMLADNGQTWMVDRPFLPAIAGPRCRAMEEIVRRRDAEHALWGFKDPRVCLFLAVWKHLLPNARVLLVYRHFSDATYSLGRRQSMELLSNPEGPPRLYRRFWEEPDLALRMWLAHNEALLAFADAYPDDVLAVSLDMAQRGFPVVEAINRRWGFELDEVPVSAVLNPASVAGRPGRQPVSDRRLIERTLATWEALERLGRDTQRVMKEATVVRG